MGLLLRSAVRLSNFIKRTLQIGIGVGFLLSAMAVASSQDMLPIDNFRSTRSEGQGGVGVSLAQDGDAVFLNPAGVGNEDGRNSKRVIRGLTLPNLTLGLNPYTYDVVKAYRSENSTNASVERAILEGSGHKNLFGYFSAFPYITLSRFQLGILVNSWGQGSVQSSESPQKSRFATPQEPLVYDKAIEVYGVSQTAAVLGFSVPYRTSGFSLGVTSRVGLRTSLKQTFEANDGVAQRSSETFKSSLNSTKGLAVDLGFLYENSKMALRPRWGLSVRDVSNTSYKPIKSDGFREVDKMNVATGLSINPQIGGALNTTLAVEGHRLSDVRVAWANKLRTGLEIGVGGNESAPLFALRGGYNGHAPTAGASVDLVFFRLSGAWYAEHVSVNSSDEKSLDQRFLLNLSIDLRT